MSGLVIAGAGDCVSTGDERDRPSGARDGTRRRRRRGVGSGRSGSCATAPRRFDANVAGRLVSAGSAEANQKGKAVAGKAQDIRPKITLACMECKERNYITKKNRRNDPDRLELKKYCPRDRKHTVHRETR